MPLKFDNWYCGNRASMKGKLSEKIKFHLFKKILSLSLR